LHEHGALECKSHACNCRALQITEWRIRLLRRKRKREREREISFSRGELRDRPASRLCDSDACRRLCQDIIFALKTNFPIRASESFNETLLSRYCYARARTGYVCIIGVTSLPWSHSYTSRDRIASSWILGPWHFCLIPYPSREELCVVFILLYPD